MTRTDRDTRDLLADHQQDERTWPNVEMARRDADATIYETFFTQFQTEVELSAYRDLFDGFQADRGIEIGCGTGRTMSALPGRRRVGLNLARAELLVARQRLGNSVALIQASATHMPFRDGVFDAVLCAGVVHHIPGDEQREAVFAEMERITTPHARIVLAAHSYSWIVAQMFPREMVFYDLFWHRFTASELRSVLSRVFWGARVRVEGICHLPRWRVGSRLGRLGVRLDRALSAVPGLARFSGSILVARVDRTT